MSQEVVDSMTKEPDGIGSVHAAGDGGGEMQLSYLEGRRQEGHARTLMPGWVRFPEVKSTTKSRCKEALVHKVPVDQREAGGGADGPLRMVLRRHG